MITRNYFLLSSELFDILDKNVIERIFPEYTRVTEVDIASKAEIEAYWAPLQAPPHRMFKVVVEGPLVPKGKLVPVLSFEGSEPRFLRWMDK